MNRSSPSLQPPHASSFFTERARHPQDQHSFPTRRSSDLLGGMMGGVAIVLTAQLWKPLLAPEVIARIAGFGKLDRKSTRLNSSHVAISYAVFCLKKKRTRKFVDECPRRYRRAR